MFNASWWGHGNLVNTMIHLLILSTMVICESVKPSRLGPFGKWGAVICGIPYYKDRIYGMPCYKGWWWKPSPAGPLRQGRPSVSGIRACPSILKTEWPLKRPLQKCPTRPPKRMNLLRGRAKSSMWLAKEGSFGGQRVACKPASKPHETSPFFTFPTNKDLIHACGRSRLGANGLLRGYGWGDPTTLACKLDGQAC